MAQWRSSAWAWTLNAPSTLDEDDQELWLLCEADSIQSIECLYVCYKGERVNNGHLQGFIQFSNIVNFKAVKAMFHKSIHIEKCLGSAASNYKYVAKSKSAWRIPFWEKGELQLSNVIINPIGTKRTIREEFDPAHWWKEFKLKERESDEIEIAMDALKIHDPDYMPECGCHWDPRDHVTKL